jgi:ribosomal protein S21
LPIIIKAKKQDSLNDVIKKFKKQVAISDIVTKVKDRQYFSKPSKKRAMKKIEMNRLRKRLHSLKLRKNISPEVLDMMRNRLGN